MNFVAFPGRHRRLLALCGLSLLLHALVIAWIDARMTAPAPLAGTPGLAVRLANPQALPSPPAKGAPPPDPVTAPEPVSAYGPAEPAAAPAPPTALPAAAPGPAGESAQMPSRYRVAVPPGVKLSYEVSDASGTGREASLAWDTDGVQYRMALDGVLGNIESTGGTDDAGIAPARASFSLGTGAASIAFEREHRRIVLESVGRSVQDTPGSQDGATVLMQLSGIALADPDQLQDAVEIYVGRAHGAAVERYQVVGKAQLASKLGTIDTLHLARAARNGETMLEVWLAPAHGWLPVQLRTTAADGGTRTQLVTEITPAPARSPAQ